MGRRYQQLSLDERCEIARLQGEGRALRQIATALDRTPSTISREIRRNRGRQVGYKPGYAQEQAGARRWAGSRLEWEPALRRAVLDRLAQGWSPEQVAGRLAREAGRRSSATRASTASSMSRSPARRTIAGGTTCRAARAGGGSAAAGAVAPQASLTAGFQSPNALPTLPTARPRATGKPTSCCSLATATPCSPCTSGNRAC
jgi:ParB-like chromosome segregation protein Spo0J